MVKVKKRTRYHDDAVKAGPENKMRAFLPAFSTRIIILPAFSTNCAQKTFSQKFDPVIMTGIWSQ